MGEQGPRWGSSCEVFSPERSLKISYWMWLQRKKGAVMRKDVNRGQSSGAPKRWGAEKGRRSSCEDRLRGGVESRSSEETTAVVQAGGGSGCEEARSNFATL